MRLLPLCLLLIFICLIAVQGISSERSSSRSIKVASTPMLTQAQRDSAGNISVTLRRARDSHFYADARINGRITRVMVDSGASVVVLRRRDAEAMGIQVDRLPIEGEARTAGGLMPVRAVRLNEVDVGGIKERNVMAAIVDLPPEADMPAALLGQSFLSRLNQMDIRGDELVMR